ncbi:hypothetical protein HZH68_001077 [Vespula germanica]|uniref:Uncharacterized protein n=1 Tax=Vespula germanica TaxID=30212 RepID=A0A834NUW6_VESGE|nr:hypothetical protein HZH68_001077 [Vespula germanica]
MRIVSLYAHVSSPQNGSMLEIAQPAGEYEQPLTSRHAPCVMQHVNRINSLRASTFRQLCVTNQALSLLAILQNSKRMMSIIDIATIAIKLIIMIPHIRIHYHYTISILFAYRSIVKIHAFLLSYIT